MSEFWNYDTVRVVNFVLLFISFFILVRRGAYKLFVDRKNFYWDRLMNLVWCTVACVSIGDVLYKEIQGGWRVWLVTAAAVLQLYVVIWRSPYHVVEKSDVDV